MTVHTSVTLDTRHELCATPVTLNGNRARISGALLPFARVTDTTTRLSAEWAWETVARVVANGGRFES